jgi:glycerol-3-phosphate acyltransferase PlsY
MIFNMFTYFLLPIAYLVGCFPSGVLIAKIFGADITQKGSGNVGATNVARVVGKKAGIATLLVDITKGIFGASLPYLALGLGFIHFPISGSTPPHSYWTPEGMSSLCGFACILGHCFSLPGLKGGKGVATALGVVLAIAPITMSLLVLAIFAGMFATTRIVSCSSLAASAAVPLLSAFYFGFNLSIIFLAMASVIWLRHKDNIRRLLKGEEKRFSSK